MEEHVATITALEDEKVKLNKVMIFDYIDVGDGCWGRNVLVTTLRCWRRFWPFWSPTIFLH